MWKYVVLKVSDEGNLTLKYKLGINVANEVGSTNVHGKDFKLLDHINFAVIDVDRSALSRDDLVAAATEGKPIKAGYTSEETPLYPKMTPAADNQPSEKTVTLVVWMPKNVGNEANYKTGTQALSSELGINVVATQLNHEKDSYGPDYDKDAEYPITSLADINAAINSGKSPIVLDADFTVDVGPEGWTAFYFSKDKHKNMASQITLKGSGKVTSNHFVIWARDGADITIDGGTYETAYNKTDKDSHLVYANAGGKVTINGGTFISGGRINYMFNVQDANPGTIIIQGGLYDRDPSTQCGLRMTADISKLLTGIRLLRKRSTERPGTKSLLHKF